MLAAAVVPESAHSAPEASLWQVLSLAILPCNPVTRVHPAALGYDLLNGVLDEGGETVAVSSGEYYRGRLEHPLLVQGTDFRIPLLGYLPARLLAPHRPGHLRQRFPCTPS